MLGLVTRPHALRRLITALALIAVSVALAPATAAAWYPPGTADPAGAPGGTPTLISSQTVTPPGYRLTGAKAMAIAAANSYVADHLKGHPGYTAFVYTLGAPYWQVDWFAHVNTPQSREEIEAYVDDQTGQVTQAWTGAQVGWTMARGYQGAFGKAVNSWSVWIPLCVAFLFPFIPWRRRPSLWHLDLLVLLSFSVSLDAFNKSNIGLSVATSYPPMLYLLVRLLLLAVGRGLSRAPLRLTVPTPVLVLGIIFLVAFRIGLNVTNSNVIDVGYSGVIGSSNILHGQPIYGSDWPASDGSGDTYGPVNYYAYVPATAVLGYSGNWDGLPAAHAAAIAFDLLTMLGLFFLGRSIRGPTTGIVLAYLWAAFPFTTYALCCNVNDSLVAMLVVAALLAMRSPPGRGALAAIAGLTKYGPLTLAPLMLRGVGEPPTKRQVLTNIAGFVAGVAAVMAPVVLAGELHAFWTNSILFQLNRPAPFSVWSLWVTHMTWPLLTARRIVLGLSALLGLAASIWPAGRRSMMQVAALGGAVIILVECSLSYWLYTYIMWFYALVIIALVLAFPAGIGERADDPASAAIPLPAGAAPARSTSVEIPV